jgi:predicted nucleic acid-binding protein
MLQRLRSRPASALDYLDAGEREAIALAGELEADQILLDESDARQEAARRKLPYIGTPGILRREVQLDLIDCLAATSVFRNERRRVPFSSCLILQCNT